MQTTVYRDEVWDEKMARFVKSRYCATEDSIGATQGARALRDESCHMKVTKLDEAGRISVTDFDGDGFRGRLKNTPKAGVISSPWGAVQAALA